MQATLNQTNLRDLPLDTRLHLLHQTATELGQLHRRNQALKFQQILVNLGMPMTGAAMCWKDLDPGWGRQVAPDQATSNTELAISLGILLQASTNRPRNTLLYWLLQTYLPDQFGIKPPSIDQPRLLFQKTSQNRWGDTLPAYKIYQGEF